MKEIIVVWLISMDPRNKKKNKLQDIIKTIETRMELGWLCGEKDRQLLDNPHYDAPGHIEWGPRKTKDEMEG